MRNEEDRNVSEMLEKALADNLRMKQSEQWLTENSEAIHAYNECVEIHGVFSDNVRSF